jgi:hypothetical protein
MGMTHIKDTDRAGLLDITGHYSAVTKNICNEHSCLLGYEIVDIVFIGEFFRTTMSREAAYYNVMFVHIYSNVYDFVSQKTENFICITV